MSRETIAKAIVDQYEQLLLSGSDLLFATLEVPTDTAKPVAVRLMFETQDDDGRPTVGEPVDWQEVEAGPVRAAAEKLIKLVEEADPATRANLARVFPDSPKERSLNISDVRQLNASTVSRPRPGR